MTTLICCAAYGRTTSTPWVEVRFCSSLLDYDADFPSVNSYLYDPLVTIFSSPLTNKSFQRVLRSVWTMFRLARWFLCRRALGADVRCSHPYFTFGDNSSTA